MKTVSFLLLLLACLALRPALTPVLAQDGDDDGCTTIESSDDDQDGEDAADEQRKKNAGLAGGGKGSKDDPGAPKLKMTLQEKVNTAIKDGVRWLKKRQGKDGSWGPVRANSVYGQPNIRGDFVRDETGPTSFAVYTLAKCGVTQKDKVIRSGIKWLKERTLKSTHDLTGKKPVRDPKTHGHKSGPRALTPYESASIVLMIEAVYEHSAKLTRKHRKRKLYTKNSLRPPHGSRIPKEDWRWMNDRILHLTKGRTIRRGRGTTRIPGTQNKGGGWRYGQANGDQDLSATQVVLLALRAASQAGYPIDRVSPNTWLWAAQFAKQVQLGNGGFGYQKGKRASAGMDACGIGSLVICKEQMLLQKQTPPAWIDNAIKRGLDHLDQIWEATRNVGEGRHHYYHLYGVERVGDLTGRHEFHGMNWYVRGARFLISQQQPEGSWASNGFEPRDVLGTCFALLFLKRATIPTVTITEK